MTGPRPPVGKARGSVACLARTLVRHVDTRMAVELCPGGHSNDAVVNGGARWVGAYFCGAPCGGVGSQISNPRVNIHLTGNT